MAFKTTTASELAQSAASMADGKIEAARIGGGAALVTIWGMTLNEWVAIITFLYFVLQIIILAPRTFQIIKAAWKRLPGIQR